MRADAAATDESKHVLLLLLRCWCRRWLGILLTAGVILWLYLSLAAGSFWFATHQTECACAPARDSAFSATEHPQGGVGFPPTPRTHRATNETEARNRATNPMILHPL